MKLNELVAYKLSLDNIDLTQTLDYVSRQLSESLSIIDRIEFTQSVQLNLDSIVSNLLEIQNKINGFKKSIQEQIDTDCDSNLKTSHDLYLNSFNNDTAQYVLLRNNQSSLMVNKDARELFISRLKNYTDFKIPAMEIRPANGMFTQNITNCDPLYLVDESSDHLQHMQTYWTEMFQLRLRYYVCDLKNPDWGQSLPQQQIGLIVSTDFFEYCSLEAIKMHLVSCWNLLRPGGNLMFTYNNCDLPYGVKRFENFFSCYTPQRLVEEICQEIGFNITAATNFNNAVSWIELSKPGVLSSIRAGQTLGKIIPMEENT